MAKMAMAIEHLPIALVQLWVILEHRFFCWSVPCTQNVPLRLAVRSSGDNPSVGTGKARSLPFRAIKYNCQPDLLNPFIKSCPLV